jgi:hypothetical protein
MQFVLERGKTSPQSRCRTTLALLLCALGFALTVYVFYPSVMTSSSIHSYIAQLLGDWRSPLMALAWQLIDPIAPRAAASTFASTAFLYGLGLVVRLGENKVPLW